MIKYHGKRESEGECSAISGRWNAIKGARAGGIPRVYCGLCKTIGKRYGTLERLTLSYDCAFLAAFLHALSGGASFTRGNCGPRC
jgi:hypothetical protein